MRMMWQSPGLQNRPLTAKLRSTARIIKEIWKQMKLKDLTKETRLGARSQTGIQSKMSWPQWWTSWVTPTKLHLLKPNNGRPVCQNIVRMTLKIISMRTLSLHIWIKMTIRRIWHIRLDSPSTRKTIWTFTLVVGKKGLRIGAAAWNAEATIRISTIRLIRDSLMKI